MVVLHSRGAPLPHICSFQLGLMEEGSNVRLVRCPKCENLLPELPNVAVYQCGGCGAVLQANNRVNSGGGASEFDGFGVSSGKLESFPEEEEGEEMSDASEVSDREGNGIRVVGQRGTDDPSTSSSSRTDTKAPVVDENIVGSKYDRRKEKSSMEKDIGGNDPTPSMGIASRSIRLGEMASLRSGEGVGSAAYRRPARTVAEEVRFPRGTSTYPDEGPSNYQPVKSSQSTVGPDRVEHLEQDRAELLRQLEELSLLKAQLSRPRDVPNERVPVDAYAGRDAWFPEGSSRQQRPLMQNFPAERLVRRPLYANHATEPVPAMNRHGLDMQNFYASSEIPGYGDPYAPQMVRSSNPPSQYHQHPSHDYFPSHYMGMDASFPTNTFFHQPACSCAHCYNKRWHSSSQVPPGALHNRRLLDAPANPVVYNVEAQGTYGPRGHRRTNTNPLPIRLEPRPRLRMQRSLDTGNRGRGQVRPRTVLAVKRNGRRCYPVAGGAPFVTCPNCFELLPLPRKVLLMTENYRKLRCGACSTILSLMFDNSRIVVSVPAESDGAASTVDDRFIGVVKESILGFDGQANNRGGMYSSDGDSSGYNFHLTDAELGSSSMDRRLNLSNSEKLQGLVSSCSTTSDDEVSPDSVIAQREVPNSEELPMKAKGTPPVPGSPLRENSSSKQVGSKFEKGNRSKRVNQEESVAAKPTSRQNSVKDVVATEMDVSSNEYPNGGMTQDSGDVSKDDRPKGGKGGDSFFGLIKKSFRHQTGENDKSTVFVNGHPISDRLVKKAEKHSGPIHPGHYWYDFRAGFWGAMGQPCLGIIPPSIEEFNFPMPKNCACGNTGVSVNGRELHQKDLDLLASRGLPRTTNKSYIIDISGKVFDEESGEELDNLGKLAPTVEKLKRGFGLRVPRVAAA